METHSSFLALKIPWREEPVELQPMRSQRVRYDWVSEYCHKHTMIYCSALKGKDFPRGSVVKNPPGMQEMKEGVHFLSGEDNLEEEMATGSSILCGKIPWTITKNQIWLSDADYMHMLTLMICMHLKCFQVLVSELERSGGFQLFISCLAAWSLLKVSPHWINLNPIVSS